MLRHAATCRVSTTYWARTPMSDCSEPDGLAFNDWVPLDSMTYASLERVTIARVENRLQLVRDHSPTWRSKS